MPPFYLDNTCDSPPKPSKIWQWLCEHPITILNAVLPVAAYLLDMFGEHYVRWHVGIVTVASAMRDVWRWSKSKTDADAIRVVKESCPDEVDRPPEPPQGPPAQVQPQTVNQKIGGENRRPTGQRPLPPPPPPRPPSEYRVCAVKEGVLERILDEVKRIQAKESKSKKRHAKR